MAKRKLGELATKTAPVATSAPDDVVADSAKVAKKTRHAVYEPTDEFQQVTDEEYIRRHRVRDLGYGADVFAQDHVSAFRGGSRLERALTRVHR